jgi:hypothetical protein
MQLFILLLIALVVGYLIARSRWSKNIDDTASTAAKSTQSLFERTRDRLRRKPKETEPQGEIVESTEESGN